jgi:hypothetical protein
VPLVGGGGGGFELRVEAPEGARDGHFCLDVTVRSSAFIN